MEQTGHWSGQEPLDLNALKQGLRERFDEVDFDQAREDVLPFIEDVDALSLWSREFFVGLIDRLQAD